MFLHSLRIQAYRNFVDLAISFEGACTVIIGENNAGKTNVLDALYAALRVNRTVRQGAFEISDYHLANANAMAGDAGPIKMTAVFKEARQDDWPDDIIAQLGDIINIDPVTGIQSIVLQVTSTAPGPNREEQYEWTFLDAAGNPFRLKHMGVLSSLQRLRPYFGLDTLRDASKEFTRRSTYFGPFVSDPTFEEPVRNEIVTSLNSINEQVLAAHDAFDVLKENLNVGNRVVQPVSNSVKIEAVPSRLSDLLANTQVSYQNRSGVTLPVNNHGSGTQSLSVISLFRAYVQAKLASRMDPLSSPIVTIEEPEAHLHPTAVRSLWALLSDLPGQRIVTTHSGDLVSEVPLSALRKLSYQGANIECRCVDESAFSAQELRHINYQVRAHRGELLFARAWLLVEGRSEMALLPELARISSHDLLAHGVRLVEYVQHGGPEPCIKLADQLGIRWHVLTDGDGSGQDYAADATAQLNGRNAADHITTISSGTLESYLCEHGFLDIYLAHVPAQNPVMAAAGTPEYFREVAKKAINRRSSKEERALEVSRRIEEQPLTLPGELLMLIGKMCQ